MAKTQPPNWLELVQKLERTIGEPVEAWTRSDAYFDLLTHASRAYSQWTRAVEGLQREWLHLFNLPANSDLTSLREQLARMERRLNDVGKELADRDWNGGDARPTRDGPPPTD